MQRRTRKESSAEALGPHRTNIANNDDIEADLLCSLAQSS